MSYFKLGKCENIGFERDQYANVMMLWQCKQCGYVVMGVMKLPKLCTSCISEIESEEA